MTRYFGVGALSVIVSLMTIWAALAIYYSNLPGEYSRLGLATLMVLASLAAFIFLPRRRRTLVWFLVVFAGIVVWWTTIPASNTRHWEREVGREPYATIEGNSITIHDIRDFRYRTEKDFDAVYYDKTFDLTKLDSADLIAVYWMGDAIAHIMITFGFQGKDFITFSIETRKEQGEEYSTIKGFFKQYELIYVVGDERDLIRVRTDYRKPQEDVYLYRLRGGPKRVREVFMAYIRQINAMKQKAEWYNTLTTNCTTSIIGLMRITGGRVGYDWKVLLSGYTPLYAYEFGALDTRIPFEELRRRSYINPRAHAIGNDPEFSRKIREGLPLMDRTGRQQAEEVSRVLGLPYATKVQ
ncbi:MAG TPA: hypothetical protein DCR97_05260 [Deltaproteobacteria bacterium]|jgi:hypothetical protein|nr:hypothetical protein [Deltaproteobacteria bacterium]